jgi:hypothetical protein
LPPTGYGAFFHRSKIPVMLFFETRYFSQIAIILLGLFSMGSVKAPDLGEKKRYRIESGSRLYLKGTSNVNKFTCDCEDQYPGQVLEVDRNGGYARFHNVHLLIQTRKFDCHNRKIDADIQKALKADQYPHIKISLVDTWQNPKCLTGDFQDWFDVQAKVHLTITSVTKEHSIAAKAKVLGPNRFQLRGENSLQMSAFGINPPEAMFGMIKVNDWITFYFDLIVSVDSVQ